MPAGPLPAMPPTISDCTAAWDRQDRQLQACLAQRWGTAQLKASQIVEDAIMSVWMTVCCRRASCCACCPHVGSTSHQLLQLHSSGGVMSFAMGRRIVLPSPCLVCTWRVSEKPAGQLCCVPCCEWCTSRLCAPGNDMEHSMGGAEPPSCTKSGPLCVQAWPSALWCPMLCPTQQRHGTTDIPCRASIGCAGAYLCMHIRGGGIDEMARPELAIVHLGRNLGALLGRGLVVGHNIPLLRLGGGSLGPLLCHQLRLHPCFCP